MLAIESAITVLRSRKQSRTTALAPDESAALADLYRAYGRGMLAVAERILADRDDAEDVVHDVFGRLHLAIARYRDGSFGGWLKQVTTRAALMRLRSTSRRPEFGGLDLVADTVEALEGWSVHSAADEVYPLVRRLPDALRVVVVLRFAGGLSHDQIGARLGISHGASQLRLCRALKRLRELAVRGGAGHAA